ncbi:MAG: RrF2 family transcriptional regulator [bacterium]
MKISTQGRYGLRALVDLAVHEGSGAIPLREISQREEISERYLEQLFAKLRKAGIVSSVRGAHGGYQLNQNPAEITVGDVMRVLEGNLAPVDCTETGNSECEFINECVTNEIWMEIKEKIEEVVESKTLKDLKERALELKQQNDDQGYMYHI